MKSSDVQKQILQELQHLKAQMELLTPAYERASSAERSVSESESRYRRLLRYLVCLFSPSFAGVFHLTTLLFMYPDSQSVRQIDDLFFFRVARGIRNVHK